MLSPDQNILHLLRGSAALELAKQGKKIFPLIPGSKTPAIAGWVKLATTDSVQIIKWWNERDYNIGILTGDSDIPGQQYIMLDYDMKAGQQGEAMLRQHTLLGLSDTESVKTPHGVHKTYLAPKGLHIRNSVSTIATNVDVRGWHGYVVGPGSIVDGVLYTWDESNQPAIAQLPQEFIDLALAGGADKKTNEQRKTPLGELDQAAAVTLAIDYLENYAPLAVEGAGGDQTTYRVAAHVKDLGISEGMCLELLMDHYNETKCFPIWAYDSLRTKVQNAYKYGQSAPGSKSPYVEFGVGNNGSDDPQGPTDEKTAAGGSASGGEGGDGGDSDDPRVFSKHVREPMLDESFEQAADGARDGQAKPLIEGILGQGELSVIYGIPGSGKTFVGLDMAYAVATGTPWNGRATAQGAVLYVAAEGGPAVRARILALRVDRATSGVPIRLLRYPVDMRSGTFDAKRLIQLIKDRSKEIGQDFKLIVIDTLSVALAGGNDTEHMQAYLYNAKLIQTGTGANVLSIHHPGKDPGKGLRGHTALRDVTDTIIEVHAPVGSKARAKRKFVVHKLRNDAVPEFALRFTLEKLDLGATTDGFALTSCVVRWDGNDTEEMRVEMTPPEKALFETIQRWAEDAGEDANEASGAPLLAWLQTNEPDNKLGGLTRNTLNQQIKRLRENGFLMG